MLGGNKYQEATTQNCGPFISEWLYKWLTQTVAFSVGPFLPQFRVILSNPSSAPRHLCWLWCFGRYLCLVDSTLFFGPNIRMHVPIGFIFLFGIASHPWYRPNNFHYLKNWIQENGPGEHKNLVCKPFQWPLLSRTSS